MKAKARDRELLAVRTDELLEEQGFRLQETRRGDAAEDARDAWRKAAGKWRLGGIAAAVVAIGVAVVIVL